MPLLRWCAPVAGLFPAVHPFSCDAPLSAVRGLPDIIPVRPPVRPSCLTSCPALCWPFSPAAGSLGRVRQRGRRMPATASAGRNGAQRRVSSSSWRNTSEIERPSHGRVRCRIDLAGLLTGSCSEAFPARGQWLRCSECCGASQQRDCPGIAPGSLFILASERGRRNQIFGNKYSG